MKIINQIDSELLKRREITAEIDHIAKATPSKNQIKKEISQLTKADEKLIAIKNIYTEYGKGKSTVTANIYKTEKELKETEPKKKEKEPKEKPAEKPVEQPKDQPKEEPKDGKKEETKEQESK